MKSRLISLAVLLTGLGNVAAGAVSPETLRVYSVQKDTFDYAFVSYQGWAEGQTVLSINHRNGRTYFVKPGESVEDYRVVQFEPRTEKVFVASVNAEQTVKTGRVTLRGGDGKTVVLEQGKLLEQPGWRAVLVALDTGAQWSVREGDVIADNEGSSVRVLSVWPDTASVDFGQGEAQVARVSDSEKTAVVALWAAQREERRTREMLASARHEQEQKARNPQVAQVMMGQNAGGGGNMAAGRVVGLAGSEPRMFIGTEYRYPTEYEVWYLRQGTNQTIRPLVIPRKFESRMVGGSVGPGPNFTWTSVSPGYGTDSFGIPPSSPMTPYPYPLPRFTRFEYKTRP